MKILRDVRHLTRYHSNSWIIMLSVGTGTINSLYLIPITADIRLHLLSEKISGSNSKASSLFFICCLAAAGSSLKSDRTSTIPFLRLFMEAIISYFVWKVKRENTFQVFLFFILKSPFVYKVQIE